MKKILFFLTALFCSVSAWASIDVLNFTSPDQEKEYQQLTQELRCPQCQNNNIADSNATIAVDMRAKVFELLQEGKSKQQVVDYMVQRYGNFVTYDPPLTAATIMLWVLPLLLVLFGIALVLRQRPKIQNVMQNQEQNVSVEQMESLTNAERQRLQELLKDKE